MQNLAVIDKFSIEGEDYHGEKLLFKYAKLFQRQ